MAADAPSRPSTDAPHVAPILTRSCRLPMRRLAALAVLLCASAAAQAPNGGWERVPLGTADVRALQVLPDGTLLVASRGGVQHSSDAGQTWTFWLTTEDTPAVAYAPGQTLLVGFDRLRTAGGALVSRGAGAAWRAADGLGGTLASLAFTDADDGSRTVGLVAAPDGQGWLAAGNDVWHYANTGGAWTRVELPVDAVLTLARSDAGRLLAGTADGLFASEGAGEAWVRLGLGGVAITAVAEDLNGTVWAGTASGAVYRRGARSPSWHRSTVASSAVLALQAIGDAAGGVVLAGTSRHGLFRSTDGGASWTETGVEGAVVALGSPGGARADEAWAAVEGDGLRHSTDGGRSWAAVRWNDVRTRHVEASGAPGGAIVVGDDGAYGLFVYDRAARAWQRSGLGRDAEHPFRTLDDVAASPDGRLFALVTEVDVAAGASAAGVGARTTRPPVLARRNVLYRSADGGASWRAVHAFPSRGAYPNEGFARVLAAGDGGMLLAGTDRDGAYGGPGAARVYRSADAGDTWVQTAAVDADRVLTLAFGPGGTAIAGTGFGGPTVLRSRDSGRTWSAPDTVATGASLQAVVALAVTGGGAVVAGLNAGPAYRSSSTRPWVPVLGDRGVEALTRFGADGLLATSSGDVYRSDDGGRSWASTGLGGVAYLEGVAVDADGTFYAVSNQGGLFQKRAPAVAAEASPAAEAVYTLTASPNPSSGPVSVALQLPASGPVTVSVVDAVGRRIAVLFTGDLAAGLHRFPLDTAHLGAGVYAVRADGAGGSSGVRISVVR